MRSVVDQLDMQDPVVSVEAARAAAGRLGRAGGAAEDAVAQLTGVVTPSWVGAGNEGWIAARGRVGARLDAVAGVASAAARVLVAYAAAMEDVLGEVALARRELAEAQSGHRLAVAGTGVVPAAFLEAGMAAWARHDRAMAAYREAVAAAAGALERLRDEVADRPISVGEHLGDFAGGLWDGVVAGPVKGSWALLTGPFTDPGPWWDMVSGSPGAVWAAVTHPVATSEGAVGAAEFRDGRWGAGAAVAASSFLPSKKLKVFASAEVRGRFARNMADPAAPRPRLQTVDEMIAGVELARHEHHDLGHAIRRHVDVDDDYLEDRLTHGTLEDNATRRSHPKRVSAWDDLETAERSITQALVANEATVRAMAGGGTLEPISFPLGQPAGRVMTGVAPNFTTRTSQTVRIVFKRDGNRLYIQSAYLE